MKTSVTIFFLFIFVSFLTAQNYTYDSGGRLTAAAYANGTQVKYTYDTAGNITNFYPSNVLNNNAPAIAVLTPSPGSIATSTPLTISGTATGANQVIFVFYQLNNGAWQLASTANQWTNWVATTALNFGANNLTVMAQDAVGNTASTQLSINCVQLPLWTPTQLGTNLTLWLDAANTNTIILNGNNVSQWNDLSGYDNNVANANVSSQPIYQINGLNNLPTINFTSLHMGLFGAKSFGVSGSAPRAMAAVMNGGSIATGTTVILEGFGFTCDPNGHYVYVPYLYGQGDIYTTYPSFYGNPIIAFGQCFNGTNWGYVDGSVFGNNTFTPKTVPGTIQLGSRSDGWSQAGELSEIIYVTNGLSTSQQQQLEGYLAWKWGLQTNLPANHPYRYSAPLISAIPSPTLKVSSLAGQGLSFQLNGVAGYPYILQSTTNLTSPANWQLVATNSADSNGNWQFTDTNQLSAPARFYRVTGQYL